MTHFNVNSFFHMDIYHQLQLKKNRHVWRFCKSCCCGTRVSQGLESPPPPAPPRPAPHCLHEWAVVMPMTQCSSVANEWRQKVWDQRAKPLFFLLSFTVANMEMNQATSSFQSLDLDYSQGGFPEFLTMFWHAHAIYRLVSCKTLVSLSSRLVHLREMTQCLNQCV